MFYLKFGKARCVCVLNVYGNKCVTQEELLGLLLLGKFSNELVELAMFALANRFV